MTQDRRGQDLSGATTVAVTAYDLVVRSFNLAHGDSIGLFKEACQAALALTMAYLGNTWMCIS